MKLKDLFIDKENLPYLLLSIIPCIFIAFYNIYLAIITFMILVFLAYKSITDKVRDKETFIKEIEHLQSDFESVSKYAVFNMPFPMLLLDKTGKIVWHNTLFQRLFEGKHLVDDNIKNHILQLDIEKLKENYNAAHDNITAISIDGKEYNGYYGITETKNRSDDRSEITLVYLVENTKLKKLEAEIEKKNISIAFIFVDNYDDIRNSVNDINRNLLFAELDSIIKNYFKSINGVVKKYENDKYFAVFERGYMEVIEQKRFELLDQARDLYYGNPIPVTLSVGICSGMLKPSDLYDKAEVALNMALGRGGDQAVVESNGQFKFFGGKFKAVEKRNKVKARVIAYALKQLISSSDNVFVMGHKNPDMDAVGSAVGVLRIIEECGKTGYFVTLGENPSVKNLYEFLREDGYDILKKFIQPEMIKEYTSKNSLLIVVDNHKPSMVECPNVLEIIPRTVVIDHHRRGAEFIADPLLTYLEPYASSTSELVTEILTYVDDKVNLTKTEAECLLAGITVDTRNFTFSTGVRTFEAASILKKAGADTTIVSQLFREDYSNIIVKAEVIKNAKIKDGIIAISRLKEAISGSVLIAAESANELLNINGIEASFVLVEGTDHIHVSGRSYGKISVQLIMERMGGGGHLNSAGVQINGISVDEAERLLIETIDEYFEEEIDHEDNSTKGS